MEAGSPIPFFFAGVAELADAPDLGSGIFRCAGSTPVARTKYVSHGLCLWDILFLLSIYFKVKVLVLQAVKKGG